MKRVSASSMQSKQNGCKHDTIRRTLLCNVSQTPISTCVFGANRVYNEHKSTGAKYSLSPMPGARLSFQLSNRNMGGKMNYYNREYQIGDKIIILKNDVIGNITKFRKLAIGGFVVWLKQEDEWFYGVDIRPLNARKNQNILNLYRRKQ